MHTGNSQKHENSKDGQNEGYLVILNKGGKGERGLGFETGNTIQVKKAAKKIATQLRKYRTEGNLVNIFLHGQNI